MDINWNDLFNAIALVLIIEGILPFANPKNFKKTYLMIQELSEQQLRIMGMISIGLGMLILFLH